MSELEQVSIRLVKEKSLYSEKEINTPFAAVELLGNMLRELDRELLAVINVNNRMMPINVNIVTMGTVNSSCYRVADVFKSSILSNATNVFIMHNHPSGRIVPSVDDIASTKKFIIVGRLLGIEVLDHIIVGPYNSDYYSFREEGKLSAGEMEEKINRIAENIGFKYREKRDENEIDEEELEL